MSGAAATPSTETRGDPAPEADDAGLATARWLAGFHHAPFTAEAALARLPGTPDTSAPETLARLLASAGLASRLAPRRLERIDPGALPCVLFDKATGVPLVLTEISAAHRTAHIEEPGTGKPGQEISPRALARRVRREVLFVTPEDRRAGDGPDAPAGHWFWRPMRANRGAWAQVVIAALAINVLGLALPIFVMNVYDKVIPNLAFVTLWTLAAGVGIAVVLDFALRSLRAGVLDRIGRRLDTAVSSTLFRHALSLRPADLPGGALGATAILREFEQVREFFGSASLVAIIDLVFIGVFLGVLWLIVGPLTLVPAIAVPIILVLAFLAQLPMGAAVAKAQVAAQRRHKVMIEALSGLESVKSLGAEPAMQREWERASAAAARVGGRSRFWSGVATNSTQVIQQAVSVGVIAWGVFLIADGRITIGALIAANILAGRALAPLGAIAQTVFRAQYARRAMTSLDGLMQVSPERGDKIRSSFRVRDGKVEAKGLTYRYPGTETAAVDNIDLTLAPGETVALLGRVGSGKSTLGKLLAGLIPADSGTIRIDGHALAQYDPAELRAGIGYLPQEPELFTGTIGENLRLGAPKAEQEEIARALHLAGIDDFVSGLPSGLDHFIGERGQALSGGQRQGLALARLILRRPRLLFLDEPTNAMDREMETRVSARLAALAQAGTGLILCTHRPALAGIAGRMIVLDAGRKVLDGAADEVLAKLRTAAEAREATATLGKAEG